MTHQTSTPAVQPSLSAERADLLDTLAKHRFLFRFTVRDLTDEQAARRTTVSALCLGGLIKHVTRIEKGWVDFALGGPSTITSNDYEAHAQSFEMLPGETLEGLLAAYDDVARATDELAATGDLDASRPLPEAPWFPPGARWSVRRVLLHIVAETAQHARSRR